MKAIAVGEFGGPEVLKLVKLGTPSCGEDEVLIRVEAVSVNYADILARMGKYHAAGKPPFIPGLDAAGTIEVVGREVKNFKVGQRVIAFPKSGSYAEYVVANEKLTFVLPEQVDFDTGAACPIVSFTAYKLIADIARLQPGETILIHAAAGGVGTTAVQLARILGAATIIGTVGNEKKCATASDAGADHVISHEDDFQNAVLKLTNGLGVDVILDSISGTVGEKSLKCLAMYGRLVVFGHASGSFAQFKTTDLHSSCRAVLGFSSGTTRDNRPELLRDTADRVLSFLAEGRLNMKIGGQFSLEEAPKAHRWVESRQSTGKVLLKVRSG